MERERERDDLHYKVNGSHKQPHHLIKVICITKLMDLTNKSNKRWLRRNMYSSVPYPTFHGQSKELVGDGDLGWEMLSSQAIGGGHSFPWSASETTAHRRWRAKETGKHFVSAYLSLVDANSHKPRYLFQQYNILRLEFFVKWCNWEDVWAPRRRDGYFPRSDFAQQLSDKRILMKS